MAVRYKRIDSEHARDAAEWAITTMKKWFALSEEKMNKSEKSLPQSEIVRFISIHWSGGEPFPSVPSWDQDILSLCELLCVATKTFYPASEEENGGTLLWLLDGIIEAMKKWNIVSGDDEFGDIIRMIAWMDQFFTGKPNDKLEIKIAEMRKGLVMAFAECNPDLTHGRTLDAYSAILGSVSPFFEEFRYYSTMKQIINKLEEI
ncbi:MAG: hypothetical protein HW380_3389 [Magnetococcales bacterium]|nr:hypothetical protein [Magnetococcales bacterium]HIJ85929.1 hypothetical protein [Magnetococcales bacterium]